jgi:hypothetical protein
MTELEWFKCADSARMATMIAALGDARKERLLAAACVRRVWYLLTDPAARDAVAVAEEFAEGRATEEQLRAAANLLDADGIRPDDQARRAVQLLVRPNLLLGSVLLLAAYAPTSPEGRAVFRSLHQIGDPSAPQTPSPPKVEEREQCRLAREVFGNPWVRPVVRSEWMSWQDGTVWKMARTIADEGRWQELPILADALEDAGCDNASLLEHFREPTRHARGCWALDALLQRGRTGC